jgi:hypothetical protein
MTSTDPSYAAVLTEIGIERPRLGTALLQAEQQRTRTAAALMSGARFRGLDELLRHLDDLGRAFSADPACSKVAFLVTRCAADFETAIEATLSGYLAVAADAMRDVMEIENLLLDFAIHHDLIDEWLAADQKALKGKGKFSASSVRTRLHAAGEGRYATTAQSLDYQAHSAALHVGPHQHPVAAKGFSAEQGWEGDAGFWEIFQHARRLLAAIRRLTGAIQPESPLDVLANQDLPDVWDAWKRTQEMQTVYLVSLQASARALPEDGKDS